MRVCPAPGCLPAGIGLLLVCCGIPAAPLTAQSRPVRLTRTIEFHNPAWSPDGRALLFESTLDGPLSVYAITADGAGLRRLTPDGFTNTQPRWSPDGRRVVFSSDRAGHLDIYAMNADGSGQARLTTTAGGGYYQSSFSPDGRLVVFQGRPDNRETRDRIFVVASDGTGLRQLTDSAYGAEGPRWSPDGRTITFRMVPYPKRRWEEMREPDMAAANAGARRMSIRPDGSGLAPAPAPGDAPRPADSPVPADAEPSPDGCRNSVYLFAITVIRCTVSQLLAPGKESLAA